MTTAQLNRCLAALLVQQRDTLIMLRKQPRLQAILSSELAEINDTLEALAVALKQTTK